MKTYHLGLRIINRQPILEVADTVDQLHCETMYYYGERETTIAELQRNRNALAFALNTQLGMTYNVPIIRRIHKNDFSAGC